MKVKNEERFNMNGIVLLDSFCSKGNAYLSRDWNVEDTYKYVFKVNESIIEAGYYIHYLDNVIVDKTIELSTSYGCVCKCKYCASSQISSFNILESYQLMYIFNYICKENNISNNENNLIIAMTGTGDYRYTYENTNEFLLNVFRLGFNAKFIISSCAWEPHMLEKAEFLYELGVKYKFLQSTYISHNQKIIRSVIPNYPNGCDMNKFTSIIQQSKLLPFSRINYLLIKGVNDDEKSFSEFLKILMPIKEKILVRISKLNATHCSQNNGLESTSDDKLFHLKLLCENNGIKAYVFKSQINDNMNCGQLITEKD